MNKILYQFYDKRGIRSRIIITGTGKCSINCYGNTKSNQCRMFIDHVRGCYIGYTGPSKKYYNQLQDCKEKYGRLK